jgi:hypothetical protein
MVIAIRDNLLRFIEFLSTFYEVGYPFSNHFYEIVYCYVFFSVNYSLLVKKSYSVIGLISARYLRIAYAFGRAGFPAAPSRLIYNNSANAWGDAFYKNRLDSNFRELSCL